MSGEASSPVALAAAVASGALVAVQQRVNGTLGRSLHDSLLAAVVSFGSGLVVVGLIFAVRRTSRARLHALLSTPWWWRLGGLGGATLVAVGAAAAPQIGVALLTVGLVAGSTFGALLVDRVGLAPGGHRPMTGPRLVGVVLCLAAIVLSAHQGLRNASPGLLVLVVCAGGLVSVQQALNGRIHHVTDATVTTLNNFVVGTTALLTGLGIRALLVGVHADRWPSLRHVWDYSGGTMGVAFIAIAAVVVHRLGVLRMGLAITAGQLLGGLVLDLDRGISATTLLACILVGAAVAVSGMRTTRDPEPMATPV